MHVSGSGLVCAAEAVLHPGDGDVGETPGCRPLVSRSAVGAGGPTSGEGTSGIVKELIHEGVP